MSRLLYIKNFCFFSERFSIVIDLYHFALPLSIEKYPGAKGWTYRIILFNIALHIRTDSGWQDQKNNDYDCCDSVHDDYEDYEEYDEYHSYTNY